MFLLILVLSLISCTLGGYDSCLQQRSQCLRNPACRRIFESFEHNCGYSLSKCSVPSPSDCVRDIWRIREFFTHSGCVCYDALGLADECDFFRQLIWNHPCERRLLDAKHEYQLTESYRHIETSTALNTRYTRIPLSDKVRQWKTQLSGELETRDIFRQATCDEALNRICLQHVSCRQLWKLFRSSCGVDQENQCIMDDKDICWQSFEGLTWTGLGSCQCNSNNSDCHWIRLHTNYNKCIYEISKSRAYSLSFNSNQNPQAYQQRYESQYPTVATVTRTLPQTTVTPTTARPTTTTTNTTTTTTTPRNVPRRPWKETTSAPDWWVTTTRGRQSNRRRNEDNSVVYRPLSETKVPPIKGENTPSYYKYTTQGSYFREEERFTSTPLPVESSRSRDPGARYDESRNNPYPQSRNSDRDYQQNTNYRNPAESRREDNSRRENINYSNPARQDSRTEEQAKLIEEQRKEEERRREEAENSRRAQEKTPYSNQQPRQREQEPTGRSAIEEPRSRVDTRNGPEQKTYSNPQSAQQTKNSSDGERTLTEESQLESKKTVEKTPYSNQKELRAKVEMNNGKNSELNRYEVYPSKEEERSEFPETFKAQRMAESSTCQQSVQKCEESDDCKWHWSELRIRCSRNSCNREECATALQRFSRYVPYNLVEAMMFCECSNNDTACHQLQDLIYPKCLYTSTTSLPTCIQNMQRCELDSRCRSLKRSLSSHCPIENGVCARSSLDQCRRTILSARATLLEQPCFCPLSNVKCIAFQRNMLPNNPCIESAMEAYSRTIVEAKKEENRVQIPTTQISFPLTTDPSTSGERKSAEVIHQTRREQTAKKPRQRTTTTTTTTEGPATTEAVLEEKDEQLALSGKKLRYRTTMSPPTSTEAPPPWETTTTAEPTTTTTFQTQTPPPQEGCNTRDANGRPIFVNVGSVIRKYIDWSSRCSSWCECSSEENLTCDRLPCLEDGHCEAPLTTIEFGERLFLKERGACFCETSKFICDFPEEMPEMYPGLYISLGYSINDIEMLRSNIPRDQLEKAGFLSSDPSVDIAFRLQIAFERMLPSDLQCRLVLMPEMSEVGSAFLRVEWFGMNKALNHTKTQWHHGWAEKVCSPYAVQLIDLFSQSDSLRYQLVLSTVKQIKVLDYLDGLPSSAISVSFFFTLFVISLIRFNCL